MILLYLCGELILLFFISRWITQAIYVFFLTLFRFRSVAVSLVIALQFPGTLVHELSHLIVAELLGVKAHKLTLVPEDIRGNEIGVGSVTIHQTGSIRQAIIGLAPFVTGIISLSWVSLNLSKLLSETGGIFTVMQQANQETLIVVLLIYVLFSISNGMYPSSSDLKALPTFLLIIAVILTTFYFVGIGLGLSIKALSWLQPVFESLVSSLALVLAINGALLLTVNVLIVLLGKILKRGVK